MKEIEVNNYILNVRNNSNRSRLISETQNNPTVLKQIVNVSVSQNDYPFPEYASWILTHVVKKKAELLQPYYNQLVDCVFDSDNQTVLRNILNCITYLKVTNYREAHFIDLLISNISNTQNKVALQVYSIYVLIQFVSIYPELKTEVEEVILLSEKGKTPAFFAAKRNFLKKTERI